MLFKKAHISYCTPTVCAPSLITILGLKTHTAAVLIKRVGDLIKCVGDPLPKQSLIKCG